MTRIMYYPAAGVLLHLCDQLWLLTPHAGCFRQVYMENQTPDTRKKMKEQALKIQERTGVHFIF